MKNSPLNWLMNMSLDIKYDKEEVIKGMIIYTLGDSIAALLLQQFMWSRFFGIMFIGGALYALEIPNYFKWIDKKVGDSSSRNFILKTNRYDQFQTSASSFSFKLLQVCKDERLKKTLLAFIYFNPLWIARHTFFIKLFSGQLSDLGWWIIFTAVVSFLWKIPISLFGNYIIQVKLSLRWRFMGSAILSSVFAIYYALSELLFRN